MNNEPTQPSEREVYVLKVMVADPPLVKEVVGEAEEGHGLGYFYPFRLMEVEMRGLAIEGLVEEELNMAGVANASSVYRVSRGQASHSVVFATAMDFGGLYCLTSNAVELDSTADMLCPEVVVGLDMESKLSVVAVVVALELVYCSSNARSVAIPVPIYLSFDLWHWSAVAETECNWCWHEMCLYWSCY